MAGPLAATLAMAVMAKAPLPGRSKTRLVPPLDPAGAAALSAAFLHDITMNIAALGPGVAGCVAYAPAGQEARFEGALAPGTFLMLADGSAASAQLVEGFGRCLLHAAQAVLERGYAAACLVNADSPTLPPALLHRAAAALAAPGDRLVLGPAEDGGYYLLGLKAAHPRLFADIAWSTAAVAGQTRERAQEIGLEVVELPPWHDVDDAASLARLLHELRAPPAGTWPAPATQACLTRLGLWASAPRAWAAQ